MITILKDMSGDRVECETRDTASEEQKRVDVNWYSVREELTDLGKRQLMVL
jgi:cation transport regulator ChaB